MPDWESWAMVYHSALQEWPTFFCSKYFNKGRGFELIQRLFFLQISKLANFPSIHFRFFFSLNFYSFNCIRFEITGGSCILIGFQQQWFWNHTCDLSSDQIALHSVQLPLFMAWFIRDIPWQQRFFPWHAKNGEKKSEEIVSKSCRACAISRPGVWNSHTVQTGCVTGFSPSCHSRAWTVCTSAGQNGSRLIKMAGEEIGLQLRSKAILLHLSRMLNRILTWFLFTPFFACQDKPLLSECKRQYLSTKWVFQLV